MYYPIVIFVPIFMVGIYSSTIPSCFCLYRYCGASRSGVFYVSEITMKVPNFAGILLRGTIMQI